MPFSEIDELPTPPQRDGDPETFADLADTFVVAMQTFSEQLNTFIAELETAAALINAAPAYADPGLVALSGNTPAADRVPYYTGSGTSALATLTSVARTLLAQASQANMRTTGLGMSANGSSLVSAADYAAMRGLLDLEAGTDFLSPAALAAAYQPLDSDLTAIAALSTTSFGRSLLEQANAAAALSTLTAQPAITANDGAAGKISINIGGTTWMIQWGSLSVAANTDTTDTYTTAFTTAVRAVGGGYSGGAAADDGNITPYPNGLSSIGLLNASGGTRTIHWWALGY